MFFSLKVRTAGEGLVVNTLMMPIGNDNVMSPVIFTMHLVGSAPLKYALTDSVKATAMGKASWDARVTGLGPRDVPAGVSHRFSKVGSFAMNISSFWFSRKKGERESSSGSGEERGRAKVCPAPVRRGVNVGK